MYIIAQHTSAYGKKRLNGGDGVWMKMNNFCVFTGKIGKRKKEMLKRRWENNLPSSRIPHVRQYIQYIYHIIQFYTMCEGGIPHWQEGAVLVLLLGYMTVGVKGKEKWKSFFNRTHVVKYIRRNASPPYFLVFHSLNTASILSPPTCVT